MGECESERTERDFQSIKAVERTRAKLRDCVSVRRIAGETIVIMWLDGGVEKGGTGDTEAGRGEWQRAGDLATC